MKGCASIIPDANGRVCMAVCLHKGCKANRNTSNDRTYTYDMSSHEVGARALGMVHLAARGEGVVRCGLLANRAGYCQSVSHADGWTAKSERAISNRCSWNVNKQPSHKQWIRKAY
eukprot:scaffold360_cov374-Pavlova_lutheri.AAC.26